MHLSFSINHDLYFLMVFLIKSSPKPENVHRRENE